MKQLILSELSEIPLNLKVNITFSTDSEGANNGGSFFIYDEDCAKLVTKFILSPMAGCNGVCIARKVIIAPDYRGNGYGSIFCNLRGVIAFELGYSAIICTVVKGNIKQEKIMAKNGYQNVGLFNNFRTGNDIYLFFKVL
jgi:RimJ/RimL family protein N-acetyltransferase